MLQSPPAAIVSSDVPAAFSIGDLDRDRSWRSRLVGQDCPRSDSSDIVVCGHRNNNKRERLGQPLPDNPTLMDDIGDKLNVRLGPIEIGSLKNGDTRTFGLRIRF